MLTLVDLNCLLSEPYLSYLVEERLDSTSTLFYEKICNNLPNADFTEFDLSYFKLFSPLSRADNH